jgi:hypothetical protein
VVPAQDPLSARQHHQPAADGRVGRLRAPCVHGTWLRPTLRLPAVLHAGARARDGGRGSAATTETLCEFGLLTTVGPRRCAAVRCAGAPRPGEMVSQCINCTPQVRTEWDRCAVSIGTGAPCERCGTYCTIPGNVPAISPSVGPQAACAEGKLTTKTVASACPTLMCYRPNSPTPYANIRTLAGKGDGPWKTTISYNVYVETAFAGCRQSCVDICTSTVPVDATLIMPSFTTVA